jgi:DNA-directed RNA polymerase subunit RPC12/RpoP
MFADAAPSAKRSAVLDMLGRYDGRQRMSNLKSVVTFIALLAVVVAAVVFAVVRVAGKPSRPEWVSMVQMEKIDRQTLEVMSLPVGKWESLGYQDVGRERRFKNPKTGTYTMVQSMRCSVCGEKIPVPVYPDMTAKKYTRAEMDDAIEAAEKAYVCPRCGKLAFSGVQKGR